MKATIVDIQPHCVTAKTEDGLYHTFMVGSLNRIKEDVVVGDEGTIEYVKSASFGLPFFRKVG